MWLVIETSVIAYIDWNQYRTRCFIKKDNEVSLAYYIWILKWRTYKSVSVLP